MTLKMTTAQVVETSVTDTNSSFQNYTHPDDHTTQTTKSAQFTFCERPILQRLALTFGETSGAMKQFSVAVQLQGQVCVSFLTTTFASKC